MIRGRFVTVCKNCQQEDCIHRVTFQNLLAVFCSTLTRQVSSANLDIDGGLDLKILTCARRKKECTQETNYLEAESFPPMEVKE